MILPSLELQSRFGLGLRLYFSFSSASAIKNPNFSKGIAVRALKLFGVFAELEDLCLVHVFQQLLRRFTQPVDLLRLAHILKNLFLVLMGLKLLDQLGLLNR